MPLNENYELAYNIPVTVPANTGTGTAVVLGQVPAVTVTATGTMGGIVTAVRRGIFTLPVHGGSGTNGGTPTVVNAGDVLYYDSGDTNATLNKNTAGVRFGYAKGADGSTGAIVQSGSVTSIQVIVGY